ncbi:IS21-like element helper ATPase IstB [Pelotomaculum terephthalicicum JT]|uniref:IS21-like element helper ATPase IstB n=1 Tax=Pelotomaculum terephthalicicum TaxID=206393 RepID=UPI001F04EA62|nr:IS21-like element helper ATPase IstB [Pelotomaculum terephthalicicum]MCG9968386.1 IS21-like element helper ATPase IstB [Pelotomaculum terephthalicicum JT]
MLNNQTLEKLVSMKLSSMGREYRRQLESPDTTALSFEERFGMLVDAEWTSRHNSRLTKLLRLANLRIQGACLEDLDYDPRRKLDRAYVARLADGTWIKEHRNLIVTGATGTGKTYLACAFGNSACRQGLKTKYYRVNRLLTDLAISRGDGSYNRLMRELKKTDLLILDDWGMAVLDPVSGRDLLEVVEDRFGYRSTIISGQLPVKEWHELFEDSTVADAVLDRLVHNAYRFELYGPSKRALNDYQDSNSDGDIANAN